MNLAEHLKIGTPLIWVNTDEPERLTDIVVSDTRRPIYRIDPFEGLMTYKKGTWKKVIVDVEGQEKTTHDFQVALYHVFKERGTLIIYNTHQIAEKLVDFFSGVYGNYRRAFVANNADKLPLQLVMFSCGGQIPPEIVRHTAIVEAPLPDVEDLAKLILHIATEATDDILPDTADLTPLTRAGLGLTEAEFTQAAMLSLRNKAVLDHQYINHFKLEKIRSGGMLEIRRPKMSLDDIGGLDLAKQLIASAVWAWNNPVEASEYGVIPLRRLLMIGVPGCGKSAICEGVASTLGLDLAKTGISQNMNKFIGQSEQNIRDTFAQIRALAPIVCWMDELGRDLSGSGVANDGGTTDRVHGEFLTGLQELPSNVFLMAAANRIHGLPPEMLRADRFDKIMFVGFPTEDERIDIFQIHLGEQATEHDLEALAKSTPVFTGAEIKALIAETRFRVSPIEKRQINTDDILQQVPQVRNRLWLKHRAEIVDMYRRAREEWEWASSGQLAEADLVISGSIDNYVPTTTSKKFQIQF